MNKNINKTYVIDESVLGRAPICTNDSIVTILPGVIQRSYILISNQVPGLLDELSKIIATDRLILIRSPQMIVLDMSLHQDPDMLHQIQVWSVWRPFNCWNHTTLKI